MNKEFLLICTIDFNKIRDLNALKDFIAKVMDHMGKADRISDFRNETNERMKSTLGDVTVEFEDIYQYLNIFMSFVNLPEQPSTEVEENAWRNDVVKPMIEAIFEPIYKNDYMSSLTWVLAPRENITNGAFGAAGGGGRTVGDEMIINISG